MAEYRLTDSDAVVRTADNACVPNDRTNRDRIEYERWIAGGGTPDPYAPPVVPETILSQDLMAQFTADDAGKIRAAVLANDQFWLLWSALQAQKDPIDITSNRFVQGWASLVQVLGQQRMDAIAAALDIVI